MMWRPFFILLLVFPIGASGQEIIWENQSFYDEQGLQDSIAFSDPANLVNVMLTWDTIVDANQSSFAHVPLYGEQFVSFEEGMQGNEAGYLTLGFDNSMTDTGDYLQVVLTFDQPVINLRFSLLDVDQGLDDSDDGPNWDDAVEVFYNGNIPALDTSFYSTGACVTKSNEPGILGFDGDSLCMGVFEFDSSANIKFHFGDTLVSEIKIKYRLTTQTQADPHSQQIGLGDLAFQPTSPALPVELTHFEATGKDDQGAVELTWETASEINSEYFEVEHAIDGISFYPVGRMYSVGHSISLTDYTYLHEDANFGSNYYRLKSVDQDGSFEYSEVRHVSLKSMNLAVFPNPVADNFQVTGISREGELILFDMVGRKVFQSNLKENIFNISHLQPGIYLMDISSSPENHQRRIIKQ